LLLFDAVRVGLGENHDLWGNGLGFVGHGLYDRGKREKVSFVAGFTWHGVQMGATINEGHGINTALEKKQTDATTSRWSGPEG
jgi:hypothetical protein